MANPLIQSGSKVALHFTLRLQRSGRIVETTRGEAPMRLTLGDGSLHPNLEAVLYGLKAGVTQRFHLPPATYGYREPQNIHCLPRNEFDAKLTLEPGNVVAFDLPNGQTVLGLVLAASESSVTVDFNHPLAEEVLDFEVEILEVD